MRFPATIYRMLAIVLGLVVIVHMSILIIDLCSGSQHEASSTSQGFEANCTAELSNVRQTAGKRNKDVEKIQQLWKKNIKRSCEKLGFQSDLHNLSRDMLYRSKILYSDKHRLLYCQVAKVASTTWRRIFIMLSEKVNITDLMTITANDAHHKYNKYLTYLSDLSRDEIIYRLNTYFKFVFVREPFGRLLSAFRNKFVVQTNASSYFKRTFGRKIIKKYRRPPPVISNGSDVKFQEFVNYLTDAKPKIPMNEHWQKFHHLCYPCLISYDFIGKLETFSEDSQYILTKNSLSKAVKIPSRSESRYAKNETNEYISQYYSTLSISSLRRLYKTYFADFNIFNYAIPDVIKYLM